MNPNRRYEFITKTLKKTCTNELRWSVLGTSKIDPLPDEKYISIFPKFKNYDLRTEYSFKAKYKTGEILLLTYLDITTMPFPEPPDKCAFSLRMQDYYGRFSVEISNSSIDPVDFSELIRLYNLIEEKSRCVDSLIDDFLDS